MRDLLLDRPVGELDVAVEGDGPALARRLARRLSAPLVTHPRFGTATLRLGSGETVDLARCRTETYPHPGSLPVVAPGTIEADLRRRDFSVNALALPLLQDGPGDLLDPFSGAADLKSRLIRVLHPLSFRDDPTRGFRACRFAARFSWTLEGQTSAWLKECVSDGIPEMLSPDRRRHEWEKIIQEANPAASLPLLRHHRLLPFLGLEETGKDVEPSLSRLPSSLSFSPLANPGKTALLLCLPGREDALAGCFSLLGIRGRDAENLASWGGRLPSLVAFLQGSPSPRQMELTLEEAPPEILAALHATSAQVGDVLQVRAIRMANFHRFVSGDSLLARGAIPGRRLGEVLETIRGRQMDGEFSNEFEALSAALSLYRREEGG